VRSSSYILGLVVKLIVLLKGIPMYKVLPDREMNFNLISPCSYGLEAVPVVF
jgi:hypothetical protein